MLYNDFDKVIKLKHMAKKTGKSYWGWIVRYCKFYKIKNIQQLKSLREDSIENFLTSLAKYCASSTQNQALQALLFLYKEVLNIKLNRLQFRYAKKSQHIPPVFSFAETMKIINNLSGDYKIMASLMYGSGLRIGEAISVRVKDIDFENNVIWVRQSKGAKDRKTLLPQAIIHLLKHQVRKTEVKLNEDLINNFSGVTMPEGLSRKYSNASKQLAWQYLFPQPTLIENKRHHIHESRMQKALRTSIIKSGINKHGSCHALRHSFASEYLRRGGNIKQLQVLLGHNSLRTTAKYTHIVDLPENNISPLDAGGSAFEENKELKIYRMPV